MGSVTQVHCEEKEAGGRRECYKNTKELQFPTYHQAFFLRDPLNE